MMTAHTSIIIASGLFRTARENNISLNGYFSKNLPCCEVGPLAQNKYRYSADVCTGQAGTLAEVHFQLLSASCQLLGIKVTPCYMTISFPFIGDESQEPEPKTE